MYLTTDYVSRRIGSFACEKSLWHQAPMWNLLLSLIVVTLSVFSVLIFRTWCGAAQSSLAPPTSAILCVKGWPMTLLLLLPVRLHS